ncbi:hypothetical protein ACOME3_005178 [Neoechinorhynchus agilis]
MYQGFYSTIFIILATIMAPTLCEPPCTAPFYCNGTYLRLIGDANIYTDSKSIVDLVMKFDWDVMEANFTKELINAGNNSAKVKTVVSKYFSDPGSELKEVIPSDWQEHLQYIDEEIEDDKYRNFAHHLNRLWKLLCREQVENLNLDRTSFLPMKYPNLVPGGRFREVYYWDSYWTAKGALRCGMTDTVKDMILNMFDSVIKYGFVPNGGRVYYTTRSQPPVLTLMVDDYYEKTKDKEFIRNSIVVLEMEFDFWVRNRTVKIDGQPDDILLFQYRTNITSERPESFKEDLKTANEAEEKMNRSREQYQYNRWLAYTGPHSRALYSIRTTRIIPVCLNSILFLVADKLSRFELLLNRTDKVQYFNNQKERIRMGLTKYMWDPVDLQWYDFDLDFNATHKTFYVSNFYPLWAKSHSLTDDELYNVVKRLEDLDVLSFPSGFPTSLVTSLEQWDLPNAWAPLQDIIIQGLINAKRGNSTGLAFHLLERWIANNYQTFKSTSNMYEKYSAVTPGYPGEGGEYEVQVGFGWTNGVALNYLFDFGNLLVIKSPFEYKTTTIVLGVVSGLLGIFSAILSIFYVKKRRAVKNFGRNSQEESGISLRTSDS